MHTLWYVEDDDPLLFHPVLIKHAKTELAASIFFRTARRLSWKHCIQKKYFAERNIVDHKGFESGPKSRELCRTIHGTCMFTYCTFFTYKSTSHVGKYTVRPMVWVWDIYVTFPKVQRFLGSHLSMVPNFPNVHLRLTRVEMWFGSPFFGIIIWHQPKQYTTSGQIIILHRHPSSRALGRSTTQCTL